MSPRILLFGLVLLAVGGLALVGLGSMRQPAHAEAPPPPPKVKILVTARIVSGGTLLKDDDIAGKAVPKDAVPAGALLDTPEVRSELHGALVLHYLDKGTRITRADVLRPRDRGFLAAVLRPGMRAITVGVDSITGTAGLIWPGDHVDLILTQTLNNPNATEGHRIVGQTILTNVRVIAVDQRMVQGADQKHAAVGNVARTITLEVTPPEAERLAVAERLGRLSATVRSAENPTDQPKPGVVYASDVSSAMAVPQAQPEQKMVVIQGGQQQVVQFR